jgi:hypothetical protein
MHVVQLATMHIRRRSPAAVGDYLIGLQWPLLTSHSAVTLPQTSESEFGMLNPPSVAASGIALISAS